MFWNLLTSAASSSGDGGAQGGCNALNFLPWLLIIAAFVAMYFFSRRSQKKQEEQVQKTLDAIQPGNKVKTIGGICGVVVELCPEDNTFILETGSEASGKSYIKFDKKAVYQTDAEAVPQAEAPQEAPVEESAPFEEVVEETLVEEAPVEETEGNE